MYSSLPSDACLCQWVITGSGNGLSPVRRQAITWTNADLLSIEPLGANNEIKNYSFIHKNIFENVVW